ncbi:MAG: RagB/SusD family nutrient uptake outer membrane protein [Prevotella sp.]|nr:RagB/SusD family nutrient uptake outer membrane protein [Prevotella sp.]
MKLNRLYIGMTLLATSMATVSCSDSWLQEDSLTESSSATFWQTEDDALMGLVACYDALQSNQLYGGGPWDFGCLNMECLTDNGGHFNWSGWMEGFDIANGTQSPSSWAVGSYWSACYEVIKRCNSLIANIDRVNVPEADRARYKAEALTIRALIYTNLTMTYNDVPYLTEPLTLDNAEASSTKRADIVSGEMAALKACVADLPVTADLGRVTRGACYAVIGRLALYNEKWDDAVQAYKAMQSLGYSLDPDYTKLFTKAGQTSPEIVMSVRFEGPGLNEGAQFNAHWNTPLEAMNGTLNLADDYYMLDGKRVADDNYGAIADGKVDVWQPNAAHWDGRDPRLKATLFVPGMSWNGTGGEGAWYGGAAASLSMVYVMKYFDPTDTGNSWDNGQDFYVIRYAEVLLSLAEALVQKGGYNESEVLALVNQVRQRAGMPTVESVEGTGLTKDALLQVIKHERRVELAFEGLRLFDLYRWHELENAVKAVEYERTHYGMAYEQRIYNGERDYVWPIPTSELDSNTKLEQNPLWK